MRRVTYSAIVVVLAPALWAQAPEARIGIYDWGGRYPHSVNEGITAIAGLGGHFARVAVSPVYLRDYHIASVCFPHFSLALAAQTPDLQQAFANPAIRVYMLTAYDGVTFGDCQTPNFLNPSFFTTDHTAAVIQEYSDFTLYLYQAYAASQKQFILSNWESDNAVYCGQAYAYATDPAFRATCQLQYASSYGISGPAAAMQGLQLWLNARAEGISQGRARARAAGLNGVGVYSAPEFNIVRALRNSGLPSVLYDVLPSVAFDYVSYSAWESINTAAPVATLQADLDTIREVTGSSAIIIGESGFPRLDQNGRSVALSSEVISAALAWGVPYLVQWQLYDTDAAHPFGLYDVDGQPTPLAAWFRFRFRQDEPLTRPAPRRQALGMP